VRTTHAANDGVDPGATLTDLKHLRRAGYGPDTSPIGPRGAKTRAHIANAALRCFTTKGYHATTVDDIAHLASTSRGTLYQYFASKDEIFVELMDESGLALSHQLRHIGPLGADDDGFANLRRWLYESCRIYDTYAPLFIEWTNVNAVKSSLRDRVNGFVDFHVRHFSTALRTAGLPAEHADVSSVVCLAILTRYNYIRHVYRPGPSDVRLVESVASALQRYLFPATPDRVLSSSPRRTTDDEGQPNDGRNRNLDRQQSLVTVDVSDPFDGLSEQASRTVRQLLDAAGRVFAANGYQATNVDHIVSKAGLARGTFYRYFSDKTQLIAALSKEAAAAITPLFQEFEQFADHRSSAALRTWLRQVLAVQRTYSGVMRAWHEGQPTDPAVLIGATEVVNAMSRALDATFGPRRAYLLDRRAGGMLLSSLLEHTPNEGIGSRHSLSDDQIIKAQAEFIERVIFPN